MNCHLIVAVGESVCQSNGGFRNLLK